MVHNSLCKHHFSLICPIISPTNITYLMKVGSRLYTSVVSQILDQSPKETIEGTSTILSLRNCYQINWHSLPSGPYLNSPRPSVFDIEGDLCNQNLASSYIKKIIITQKLRYVPISQGHHFWYKKRPMQPKLSILL
jgi:hypothetical protein